MQNQLLRAVISTPSISGTTILQSSRLLKNNASIINSEIKTKSKRSSSSKSFHSKRQSIHESRRESNNSSSLLKREKSKKIIMMNSYLNEMGKKEIEKREKSVLLGDMSGQFRNVDQFISRNLYSGLRSKRVAGIVKN